MSKKYSTQDDERRNRKEEIERDYMKDKWKERGGDQVCERVVTL